ncbi:MAG: hypothetical protein JNK64_21490 [Myxococcales bacterium]|nr:hypothetical protein [Myxococcales bacterium]
MKQLWTSLLILGAAWHSAAAKPAPPTQPAGRDALTPLQVTASSTLAAPDDRYAPWRVVDYDQKDNLDKAHRTAWCEGVPGAGVGEYVELAGPDLAFKVIYVQPGGTKRTTRATRFTITWFDARGTATSHDLASDDGGWIFEADTEQRAVKIRVAIAEVAPGKVADTCIADVMLQKGDVSYREPWLDAPAAIDELVASFKPISAALTSCQADALAAVVQFPLVYKAQPRTLRGKAKSTTYKDAAALARACAQRKGPAPMTALTDLRSVQSAAPGHALLTDGAQPGVRVALYHFAYRAGAAGAPGAWLLSAVDWR